MSFLDDAKKKAEDLVHGNEDKIKDGVDKAGDVVDDKTGGKYADKVDKAQDAIKDGVDKI